MKTFAERSKRNSSFAVQNTDLRAVAEDSAVSGSNLKEKLERFYYAYNKSLVIDDGMNFSDCDSEDNEDEGPVSKRTGNQKWSLLQSNFSFPNFAVEFICQTNLQKFEDDLENISKGKKFFEYKNPNIQ